MTQRSILREMAQGTQLCCDARHEARFEGQEYPVYFPSHYHDLWTRGWMELIEDDLSAKVFAITDAGREVAAEYPALDTRDREFAIRYEVLESADDSRIIEESITVRIGNRLVDDETLDKALVDALVVLLEKIATALAR